MVSIAESVLAISPSIMLLGGVVFISLVDIFGGASQIYCDSCGVCQKGKG